MCDPTSLEEIPLCSLCLCGLILNFPVYLIHDPEGTENWELGIGEKKKPKIMED